MSVRAALVVLLALSPWSAAALSVAAAASLTEVLPSIARAWEAQGGEPVTLSFDGTSRLAAQLEAGAPFDVFVSADAKWMEHLQAAGLVDGKSRRDIARNELVCVVPAGADFVPKSAAELGKVSNVALAGENVPAGRYARQALKQLGAWAVVEPLVVNASNVRRVLGFISLGEVDAGLVYATDASAEPAVKVAFRFASTSHAPIVYPAAVVASSRRSRQARSFVDFLASETARELLANAGFGVP